MQYPACRIYPSVHLISALDIPRRILHLLPIRPRAQINLLLIRQVLTQPAPRQIPRNPYGVENILAGRENFVDFFEGAAGCLGVEEVDDGDAEGVDDGVDEEVVVVEGCEGYWGYLRVEQHVSVVHA